MTREKLIEAISQSAKTFGYNVYSGAEYRIAESVKTIPALWINPPKLIKIEGRAKGVARYDVKMHLIVLGKQLTEKQKNSEWQTMESNAIRIFDKLAQNELLNSVENLKATPQEYNLSNFGELSMEIEFNAEIEFCSIN